MRLKSKGFTLIELVVIMSVLAILAAIVVPRFTSTRENSAKNVCYTNRAMIAKAYQLALAKGYSVDLQGFINNPENYGEYYAQKPVCPLGGVYTAVNSKIVCSHEGHNDEVVASSRATVAVKSNNLILTIKALADINKDKKSGIQLNGELKEALNGTFLPVEDYIIEMAFGDNYKGSDLTWRTDSESKTTIYFAGDGTDTWSGWKAYLLVVDGILYKTKLVHPYRGEADPANVAQLNTLKGDQLAKALAKDFEVVGSIDVSH